MAVYDKAKWHFEGEFPQDLPPYQGYVHIGLFLGWALDHGFEGSLIRDDFSEELASYRAGKITAPRLLQITDGVLDDQLLSEEGNGFAESYYESSYLADYCNWFPGAKTCYHVQDTADSARIVKRALDARYEAWKREKK